MYNFEIPTDRVNIECTDMQGYKVEHYTQWDVNQVLQIRGIEMSPEPCVRFSNKNSKVSLVVKPERTLDNGIRVDVPNILLQQHLPIVINIFYEYDDNSCRTRHTIIIPVVPCKKPEDYTPTQNVEYVCWLEVSKRAKKLIEELQSEKDLVIIHNEEPAETNILWFNTSVFDSQGVS